MIDFLVDLHPAWKVLLGAVLFVAAWVGVATVANATGTYGDPVPQEQGPVSSTDVFDTYVTHVEVDGRTITCVSNRSQQGLAMSCDWSAK